MSSSSRKVRARTTPSSRTTPASRPVPVSPPPVPSSSRRAPPPVSPPPVPSSSRRAPPSTRPAPSSPPPEPTSTRPAPTSSRRAPRPKRPRSPTIDPDLPPPLRTVDPDSDLCDSDTEYDSSYEDAAKGFPFNVQNRRMYKNLRNMEGRELNNTRFVDLGVLREMGVADDFLHLTGRIGIRPEFWNIRQLCFHKAAWEILATLQLKPMADDPEEFYVKFRTLNHMHQVPLSKVREYFGFADPTPAVHSNRFRAGLTRATFWHQLTGLVKDTTWKERRIHLPVLRVIHRAIATTIYGRVGTLSTCTADDLMLMDFMLRPTPSVPDLARLMVEHWIAVRDQQPQNNRQRGAISIGSLLIHLAISCGAYFDDTDPISDTPIVINFEYLGHANMCSKDKEITDRDVYKWHWEGGPDFHLPYRGHFDLLDPKTYIIRADYDPNPPSPSAQQDQEESSDEEEPDLDDIPSIHSTPSPSQASENPQSPEPATQPSQPSPQPEQAPSPPAQPSSAAPDAHSAFLETLLSVSLSNQTTLASLQQRQADSNRLLERMQFDMESLYHRQVDIDRSQFRMEFFMRNRHWPTSSDIPSTSAAPPPATGPTRPASSPTTTPRPARASTRPPPSPSTRSTRSRPAR